MKKSVIFAFLFMFVFTLPALAYPDLSECETAEDAYELGYYDYLIETYNTLTENPGISLREKYMLYGAVNQLYQDNAFIEFSDFTPYGEYALEDAYSEGRSSALVDFEELYKELNDEAESQPEPLTPEDAQNSYDEGYQAGYTDGQSQHEYVPSEAKEQKESNTLYTIFTIVSTIFTLSVVIFILQQLSLRFVETHPSIFSEILLMLINILYMFTFFPMLFAEVIHIFTRWSEERHKRRLAAEEELLHKHFLLYQNGEYLPGIWELEEFAKRGWRRY